MIVTTGLQGLGDADFESTTVGLDTDFRNLLIFGGVALFLLVNSITSKAASKVRSASVRRKGERKKRRISKAKAKYKAELEAAERGGWF